jgi:hypothetical protein
VHSILARDDPDIPWAYIDLAFIGFDIYNEVVYVSKVIYRYVSVGTRFGDI